MIMALGLLLLIVGSGPRTVDDGLPGPLDQRLSKKRGCVPSPVYPVLFAAAFGNRSDAAEALNLHGTFQAGAIGTENSQESRSEVGASAGKLPKEDVLRMSRKGFGDDVFEIGDVLLEDSQFVHQKADNAHVDLQNRGVGGESARPSDLLQTLVNELGAAHIVDIVKAADRLRLGGFELGQAGPLLQEIEGQGRGEVFTAPAQGLGEIVLEGTGELVGEQGAPIDDFTASLRQARLALYCMGQ